MKTRDRLLLGAVAARIGDGIRPETLSKLLEQGLLDRTACERLAIRDDVERQVRRGTPRGDAALRTARTFCCSHGKVRHALYDKT